jgi:Na+/H+ antiporter NhaD/arsenite permease-like protein
MIALVLIIFILGYLAIAFEHSLKINKTAPALIAGVLCWTVYILFSADKGHVSEELLEYLGEYAGILFFLMGAMTIVEIIDLHNGFSVITRKINQRSKRRLLWILSGITFFLSPVLDNLTTAIVMVSLLMKLVQDPKDRLYFAGMIIIAANAGGAWSPIGDITTTMLWIGGQITASHIIKSLFIPSVVCLLVPLLLISPRIKGNVATPPAAPDNGGTTSSKNQLIILFTGIGVLIAVPVFKTLTHLPPFMGILLGLGIMWVITEIIGGSNEGKDKYHLSPAYALRKIDSASILFFLGILLCIAVLQATGVLSSLADWMDTTIGDKTAIGLSLGVLSAVVDNVPLMAAAQGMYSLNEYPTDHYLWELLAYTTGTGGSALIIGSAAGVAVMGMVKVDFFWYLKNITLLALAGYFAGAIVYVLQSWVF